MDELKEKLKWVHLDFTVNGKKRSELELSKEECEYIIELLNNE